MKTTADTVTYADPNPELAYFAVVRSAAPGTDSDRVAETDGPLHESGDGLLKLVGQEV